MSKPMGKHPFGPVQIRLMGFCRLAEGFVQIFIGHHAPEWTLQYAIRTARKNGEKRRNAWKELDEGTKTSRHDLGPTA